MTKRVKVYFEDHDSEMDFERVSKVGRLNINELGLSCGVEYNRVRETEASILLCHVGESRIEEIRDGKWPIDFSHSEKPIFIMLTTQEAGFSKIKYPHKCIVDSQNLESNLG